MFARQFFAALLLLLSLLTGCLFNSHESELHRRPSDTAEGLPNWAIDPKAIDYTVDAKIATLRPFGSTAPVVCTRPPCELDKLVLSVIEAPHASIVAAISTGQVVTGIHRRDIQVAADGTFPRAQFSSNGDPILVSFASNLGANQFWLTSERLKNRQVAIFVPGDTNLDGTPDNIDLARIYCDYVPGGTSHWETGDFDGDGQVTSVDLIWMMQHYHLVIPFWPSTQIARDIWLKVDSTAVMSVGSTQTCNRDSFYANAIEAPLDQIKNSLATRAKLMGTPASFSTLAANGMLPGIRFATSSGNPVVLSLSFSEDSSSSAFVSEAEHMAGVARILIPGDANLDGSVNATDKAIMDANQVGAGKNWRQGDFNGDGVVNAADYTLFNRYVGTVITPWPAD